MRDRFLRKAIIPITTHNIINKTIGILVAKKLSE